MATFDIYFQIVPAEEQAASYGRIFSFGYTSAIGVKGPQKLINRWLKCLFTRRGSDLLSEKYGTGFTELLGSNISCLQDFTDAAVLAVNDCNDQITALDQTQFPPDDERLSSAQLTNVVPRGADGFDVYVTIQNTAGALLTVQVPTGTTP